MREDGMSPDGTDGHGGTGVPAPYRSSAFPDERLRAALRGPVSREEARPLRRSTRVAAGVMSVVCAAGSVGFAAAAVAELLSGGLSAMASHLAVYVQALPMAGVSWLFFRAARTGFDPVPETLFHGSRAYRRPAALPDGDEPGEPPVTGRGRLPPP